MKGMVGAMLAALLVAVLHTAVSAQEAGSMMCRNGIVSRGDTIPEVVKKCGPPTFAFQREQTEVDLKRRHSGVRTIRKILIDDWTYNFGPNEFMYQLIFENGRVARIESLDWGY